ncbi:MAG: methionyl-tRNA formyltransferase [Candidatus Moranbacteria bacterium]|jgi:methionyl-tRNA formyltransferase|nr:methionyl-tRNA formyltransferase [Candidatus Moranbacteria bacterium]MDX9855767.1 methionyl-tRNA formyltransferase [Candidatus Moranbacteria bacterium]
MEEKLKIVFMGTSDFAGIVLESLTGSPYEISAVVTQPDSRDKKGNLPNPVRDIAQKNNIKILQPEKLDENFTNEIKGLRPDVFIVASYGKIIPEKILEIPRMKSLNVHASLLPKLRGPSPIQNSLLQGDKETGITIMLMDKGIDTGDILSQKKIAINDDDDYITLTSKLAVAGSKLLLHTVSKWINGEINPVKQNDGEATLCQLIEKSDGQIFWGKSASEIHNTFRAFRVWPGIYTFWDNEGAVKKISLTSISAEENENENERHLGEVFQKEDKKIRVKTGKGNIIIEKLQLEGKNETEANSFINGYPGFIGSVLK